jgi:hypothetical protein
MIGDRQGGFPNSSLSSSSLPHMKIEISIIPSYTTLHHYRMLPVTYLPSYSPFIFLEIDPFDTRLPISPICYSTFNFFRIYLLKITIRPIVTTIYSI